MFKTSTILVQMVSLYFLIKPGKIRLLSKTLRTTIWLFTGKSPENVEKLLNSVEFKKINDAIIFYNAK